MATAYYCAMSLDGYIAEADDTIDWLLSYEGTFAGEGAASGERPYERFFETVGALVMGSTTYAFIVDELDDGGRWPYGNKPPWVLSSRDLPGPGDDEADVRIVDGRVRDLHDEMVAAAGGRRLWIVGGGNV